MNSTRRKDTRECRDRFKTAHSPLRILYSSRFYMEKAAFDVLSVIIVRLSMLCYERSFIAHNCIWWGFLNGKSVKSGILDSAKKQSNTWETPHVTKEPLCNFYFKLEPKHNFLFTVIKQFKIKMKCYRNEGIKLVWIPYLYIFISPKTNTFICAWPHYTIRSETWSLVVYLEFSIYAVDIIEG